MFDDMDEPQDNNPQHPLLNTFAILRVVDATDIGVFLDCGQEKDLFLPKSEEIFQLEIGQDVLVYVYLDKQDRPCSSMKIDKYSTKETADLKKEQKVDLIIYDKTNLGYKALINKKQIGIIYHNEAFQKLSYLDEVVGYVKEIRADGKIDLLLQPFGNKGADDLGLKIITTLESNNGFLDITDKTTPEKIYELFGVSKKKYKIALGGLYKKRLITVSDDGIRLTTT